jgi:hypothetical protein
MSSDRIYIRFKGRVLGPITNDKALEMVKRGQITKQHELSPDGSNWRLASEYEAFFPASSGKNTAQAAAPKAVEKAQAATNPKEWYSHFDDANQGPVDEVGLKDWIAAGKVTTKSMIWKTGMSEWMEAGTIRPEWFSRQIHRSSSTAQASTANDPDTETSILSFAPIAVKPRGWILLIAICATILSSFGIIGSSLFFISAASAPGAGPIKALLVITTLAFFASWCGAFYLCVLMFRIASAIQVLAFRSNQAEASQVFLAYNRFWKTLGILITTLLVMAFLLTFMFLALGASLAPLFSPNN